MQIHITPEQGLIDDKLEIKLTGLKAGKHKLKVKYKGADNWEPSKGKAKFKVKE